jgi:hypothetical protein
MVSLRRPDILEALIAWCLTSVVMSLEFVICMPRQLKDVTCSVNGILKRERKKTENVQHV